MDFIDKKIEILNKKDELHSFPEPIFMEEIHFQLVKELALNNFNVTTHFLATKLGCSQSTISRYISSLANKYEIKWYSQVNWRKMGLQYHIIYIRIPEQNDVLFEKLTNTLQTNRYLSNMNVGKNKNSFDFFSILICPHITAVLISRRLEKYLREGHIESFEILPVIKEEHYQGIVLEEFQLTDHNIQLLLNNDFSVNRLKTFYYDRLKSQSLFKFTKKDSMLLQFLSFDHSVPLTKKFDNDLWIAELIKYTQNKDTELSNYLELLPLLNKLQNYALKESLLNYRLIISYQPKSFENLHIKLPLNSKDRAYQKIKDVLTPFASTTIFHSHNEVVFLIKNISENFLYVPLILEHIKQFTNEFAFFFVESKSKKHMPLADLFDYQTQKWYLS